MGAPHHDRSRAGAAAGRVRGQRGDDQRPWLVEVVTHDGVRSAQPFMHPGSASLGMADSTPGPPQASAASHPTAAHSPRPRLPSVLQAAGWPPSLHAFLTDTASIIFSAWHAPQPARGFSLRAPPTLCLVPTSEHSLTRVCPPLVFSHLAAPLHRLVVTHSGPWRSSCGGSCLGAGCPRGCWWLFCWVV